MIDCGKEWQPTQVLRVIDRGAGHSEVARVETDAGIGWLKGLGSSAGPGSLPSELVGTELARFMGVATPPFAIVNLGNEIEIELKDGSLVPPGPAFISADLGEVAMYAPGLLPQINNKDVLPALIALDTMICNFDRYCPDASDDNGYANRDNLILAKDKRRYRLVALDHALCFSHQPLTNTVLDHNYVDADGGYGYLPEFEGLIDVRAVRKALEKLRGVQMEAISEVVQSVPAEWGVSDALKEEWAKAICRRAARIIDPLSQRLIERPALC